MKASNIFDFAHVMYEIASIFTFLRKYTCTCTFTYVFSLLYFYFTETNENPYFTNIVPITVTENTGKGYTFFKIEIHDGNPNDGVLFSTVYGPPTCSSIFYVKPEGLFVCLSEALRPSRHFSVILDGFLGLTST